MANFVKDPEMEKLRCDLENVPKVAELFRRYETEQPATANQFLAEAVKFVHEAVREVRLTVIRLRRLEDMVLGEANEMDANSREMCKEIVEKVDAFEKVIADARLILEEVVRKCEYVDEVANSIRGYLEVFNQQRQIPGDEWKNGVVPDENHDST